MSDTVQTIAVLLPIAIGTALSPVPLIELILVLLSKRRGPNAVAFVAALLAFSTLALMVGGVGGNAGATTSGAASTVVGWLFVGFGALLVLIGVQNWRNRSDQSEPAVLATVSGMGPAAAAFLAFGATWVNPKNLVLLFTAGRSITEAGSPILVGAIFLLVATAPYTFAAGYALLGGQSAQHRLDRLRTWLVARNRMIMAVICTPLGLFLFIKGIGSLS